MVENPVLKGVYYTVIEIWGSLMSVAVTLGQHNLITGTYSGALDLGGGYTTICSAIEPIHLYATDAEAQAAAQRERERIEIERYEGRL